MILTLVLACSAASWSAAQDAQDLQKFVFSNKTNNAYALTKARDAYNDYLNSIGLEDDNETVGYARYLPLVRNNTHFFGYQILGELGVSCPPLGCETMVFEDLSGGKSRLALHVFANHIWLGKPEKGDLPANIYVQSNYSEPDEVAPDSSLDVWKWNVETKKYEFEKKLEP